VLAAIVGALAMVMLAQLALIWYLLEKNNRLAASLIRPTDPATALSLGPPATTTERKDPPPKPIGLDGGATL